MLLVPSRERGVGYIKVMLGDIILTYFMHIAIKYCTSSTMDYR